MHQWTKINQNKLIKKLKIKWYENKYIIDIL